MKLVSLASGSSGNAFLADSGSGLLLLDAGISYKTLRDEIIVLISVNINRLFIAFLSRAKYNSDNYILRR